METLLLILFPGLLLGDDTRPKRTMEDLRKKMAETQTRKSPATG